MSNLTLAERADELISIYDFVTDFADEAGLTKCEHALLGRVRLAEELPSKVSSSAVSGIETALLCGTAEPVGRRSAYLRDLQLKLKGCRPDQCAGRFPSESCFFGAEEVLLSDLPFGVLTATQVVREILGWAFFKVHRLPLCFEPLVVYAWPEGFSLVEQAANNPRVESRLCCSHLTLAELLQQHGYRRLAGIPGLLGQEVRLDGINHSSYVWQKARLLAQMNCCGGFRDLLNSNIGNDLLLGDENGSIPQIGLCDFDTFHVIDLAELCSQNVFRRFVLQAYTEAAKSSLPIIEVAEDFDQAVQIFLRCSSAFACFRRELRRLLAALNLPSINLSDKSFEEIERWVFQTPVFRRTVGEVVPVIEKLLALPLRQPTYRPH